MGWGILKGVITNLSPVCAKAHDPRVNLLTRRSTTLYRVYVSDQTQNVASDRYLNSGGVQVTQEDTTVVASENVETNGTSTEELDLMKIPADFAFRGPIALRMVVEDKAREAKLPIAAYLKKIVADAVGFALPAEATTSRGLSEEEKKARDEAAKAKAKEERALTKRLLAESRKAAEPEATPAATA
jgi:hypothetical protein